MKNVLLLGATGTAGSAITQKLLNDTDCHITLFARHAMDADISNKRVTAINGDATNEVDLRTALKGHDVVYCAISGEQLPIVAQNLVTTMPECGAERLIFMGAVGIYNEIPDAMDGKDNVDNNPDQVPNRDAVQIIEASPLNYTILRPGYLQAGEENDFVLTVKGQAAKGYTTTISSVVKLAADLILDENLYVRKSVSITREII